MIIGRGVGFLMESPGLETLQKKTEFCCEERSGLTRGREVLRESDKRVTVVPENMALPG